MGNLFCCCSPCMARKKYSSIPEGSELSTVNIIGGRSNSAALNYDANASIFVGLEIEQKFTNKNAFEDKFVWVDAKASTIHLSQYVKKDKRHKEASLADIANVQPGLPVKYDKSDSKLKLDPTCCLTINFKKGGIDLKFKDKTTRDLWAEVISQLISQLPK